MILETTHVLAANADWNVEANLGLDSISFSIGNHGLVLTLLIHPNKMPDSFSSRLRALDVGSAICLEIGADPEPCKAVFDKAVLVSKTSMSIDKDHSHIFSAAQNGKSDGFILQMEFHVGPRR